MKPECLNYLYVHNIGMFSSFTIVFSTVYANRTVSIILECALICARGEL